MSDLELDRKVATNWQEYKAEFLRMSDMVVWVWKELVSREGRAFMLRMVGWMAVSCVLTVVLPLMFGKITDLLDPSPTQTQRPPAVCWASTVLLLLLRQFVRYRQSITREYLAGENMRQLDVRTTELFLEKSLGMHISENNHLNEANVKKGYDRVLGLEGMLLFEGIEALLNIALPFVALWIFTITSGRWPVGAIIMLILASHLAWTLFLNQQVLRVCLPIDKMWRFLNRYRVERWQRVERVKTNAKEDDERREIERSLRSGHPAGSEILVLVYPAGDLPERLCRHAVVRADRVLRPLGLGRRHGAGIVVVSCLVGQPVLDDALAYRPHRTSVQLLHALHHGDEGGADDAHRARHVRRSRDRSRRSSRSAWNSRAWGITTNTRATTKSRSRRWKTSRSRSNREKRSR